MRVDTFEVHEPVPELRDVCVIAILRPWLNAGRVGIQTLNRLKRHLDAKELARLPRPGNYYDFTRYRPRTRVIDGRRVLDIPNTIAHHARDNETGRDFILMDIREPHSNGEAYTDGVVALLKHFDVTEYCRVGAMYNSMPHTRPLIVTGNLSEERQKAVGNLVSPQRGGTYQGPTSMINVVTDELTEAGVTTTSLMAHLPQHLPLGSDYKGTARLIEVLSAMYGFPADLADFERADKQYQELMDSSEANTPEMKSLTQELEMLYDRRQDTEQSQESQEADATEFSDDMTRFLNEMGQRLDDERENQ